MYDKYNYLNKLMLTFTYNDDNKYFKMQVTNEIKNYITKLVRNTKNNNIKYYANIELGSNYDNPHLHIQFFYDDYNQLMKIRDKVIYKFGLFSKYCNVSKPIKECVRYDYVVKDYKYTNDEDLLLLDTVKRDYRAYLNTKLRFTSFTKEKYTKATYKKAYTHGIFKGDCEWLLDNFIINNEIKIIDSKVIIMVKILFLIQCIERVGKLYQSKYYDNILGMKKAIILKDVLNLYWIYGFY